MRLTTIILIASLLHVSASTLAQKITLDQKNVKLEYVLQEIRKQSGYDIYYDSKDIAPNQKISIHVTNVDINEALNTAFKGLLLTFDINGTIISIKKRNPTVVENLITAFAAIDVHGYVVDETGKPLPGATVKIKNTNQTTTTDNKGYYSITVPDAGTIIVFSFVGYESQEIIAKDIQNGSSITLKASVTDLKEVVVNKGYYTTTQALNTGDVTTVKGEDMQKQPEINPILALEGRVPGLYIRQVNGLPGSAITVTLRGTNSIANGNNPFYIVDGIPFTSTALTTVATGYSLLSPFNSLNLADIESVEILKDADATAIYGSRGANGVILITTKKGKSGKTRFEATSATGSSKPSRQIDLLNTPQYLTMRREAFNNDGMQPGTTDYDINGTWDTTRYTNWQNVFFANPSHYSNAQGSISGGDANTQFLVGGGYTYQSSYLPKNFYNKKGSAHFNLSHNSRDNKFHMTVIASYTNDINLVPGLFSTNVILAPPDAPALYDNNGNLNWANNTWNNPLSAFLRKNSTFTDNLISNLNVSYELLPGLELKANFGYSSIQTKQINIVPLTSYSPANANSSILRQTVYGVGALKTYNLEPQMHYNRLIGRGHFDVLIGTTFQQNNQNSFSATGIDYTSDALLGTLSAAAKISGVESANSLYRYNAFFTRINYNWEDKYQINLTGRRDGSSRFGPGNQFGNFGAIGAAWIFTSEEFMQKMNSLISFGKLRGSYGITGNDQLDNFQYITTYLPSSYYIYQNVVSLWPNNLANPSFRWELNRKLEGGLELGLLKDRIQTSVSYYQNRTGNQLVGYSLPLITGFSNIKGNLPAVIQNNGWEIVLNSINIKTRNFNWNTSFNISIPRNKLVAYPGLAGSSYVNQYEVGKSLYIKKKYHYTGIDAKTGIYTFEDINKDGQISFNQDAQFRSQLAQNYFGGLSNSFSYKGIQMDVLLQFVKQTGYNYFNSSSFQIPGTKFNQTSAVLNRWQESNDDANFQKFSQNYASSAARAFYNFQQSDASISDASFIRCRSVSLSYSLPATVLKRIHFQTFRLYCQMQNLFTITKYNGADPETWELLPPLKTITLGIAISL